MPQIQVLDQNTINQIAAGEVVERPASIVKELLENAIDAGASAVTVEIKEGGIPFIRITDNGCGIDKDQIPLAFLRHSTSKIRSADDLRTVASLGFRGEALSSIAAVSQVELITKTMQSLTGVCYCIEGGEEKSQEEIGAPDGTTLLIRNLFYNVPARKKFLKTAVTEGNYINELVEKIALSRPDVSIRLINNGSNKLYTTGSRNQKDVIYTIYGREITSNLIPVQTAEENIHLEGFLGKPVIARGNRSFENYFINGRYIKSKIIAKAIETAYKPFMMQHRYPFTVLHLTIDPESVDVNVHPAKMELRFKNEAAIYETLLKQLTAALKGKEFIPELEFIHRKEMVQTETKKNQQNVPEPFEKNRLEAIEQLASYGKPAAHLKKKRTENKAPEKVFLKEKEEIYSTKTVQNQKPSSSSVSRQHGQVKERQEQMLLSEQARPKHRLIGQLFDTYWLIQYEDKLFIMDQHAAHEKILYEQTLCALKNKEFTSQMISPPWIISLTSSEEAILKKYQQNFQELGYEISHFGGKEYAVSAIPGNLFGISSRDMLIDLISQLEELGTPSSQLITEKIASLSCKAAVKGNHAMSFQEADALIDQLLKLENPYACPHGRPTIISMSRYELEKKFKRII